MMKMLKNEKLARWVIGIVVVGLVMAYVPLLFLPPEPASQRPAPRETPALPVSEPIPTTTDSFASGTHATATPPLPLGGTVRIEASTSTAR